MKHASLFSGIGGFDLAAQWMGWENVFQVEIDKFCTKVLEKNFPNVTRYGDIKEFDGTKYRGTIDVLSGGFPCQPFSSSGKRKGTSDNRYLWPQMLRVIRETRPKYIVGENVYGILTWKQGMVFEQVQTDLENEGYEVKAYILPACSVNAPHRRNRVWFVAYANSEHSAISILERGQDKTSDPNVNWPFERRPSADSPSFRWVQSKPRHETTVYNEDSEKFSWEGFPTQSPVRDGNDGVSSRLVRLAIEAGGNAIVPQVAFEIFKAIHSLTSEELSIKK